MVMVCTTPRSTLRNGLRSLTKGHHALSLRKKERHGSKENRIKERMDITRYIYIYTDRWIDR